MVEKLCLVPAIIGTQLAKPSDLIQPNGLDALKADVDKNIPGSTFAMPVFLAQGDADAVVLPTITQAYAARLCSARVNLTLKTYPRRWSLRRRRRLRSRCARLDGHRSQRHAPNQHLHLTTAHRQISAYRIRTPKSSRSKRGSARVAARFHDLR